MDTGSVETYDHGLHCFMSQPVFVGRPGGTAEDDGWLLSLTHVAGSEWDVLARSNATRVFTDANVTEVVVLDALSLSRVAVLRTARPVPVPVHVSWSDECFAL